MQMAKRNNHLVEKEDPDKTDKNELMYNKIKYSYVIKFLKIMKLSLR